MILVLLLIFIHLIPTSLLAQQPDSLITFSPTMFFSSRSTDNKSFPLKSQAEIDSMIMVADGYTVFNTTTNCINYHLNQRWYALCGECIPKPQVPKIDSITSKGSKIFIFYQKDKWDSIEAYVGKKRYVSTQSPLIVQVQEQIQNPAYVKLRTTNQCGYKDTTVQISVDGIATFSPILTEEIEGKKIRYRKYGDCKWMVEDYITDKPAIPKAPYWVSMENAKNPCPKGWVVPTEKDWIKLLENFEGNYTALFEEPTDENISLGLNKYGFYITQEKKVLGQGTASYWVGEKKGNKQKLINITENGHLVPEEDTKLFMIPLRCIQCEK